MTDVDNATMAEDDGEIADLNNHDERKDDDKPEKIIEGKRKLTSEYEEWIS